MQPLASVTVTVYEPAHKAVPADPAIAVGPVQL